MKIRHSTEADVPQIMAIYARARAFMAETGNPRQWGATNWPPETLIHTDIAQGRSYVCTEGDRVIGTFYYFFGHDATYDEIDGAWTSDAPYGAVHRIASDGTHGVGSFCINYAFERCGHLRIDTHPDNRVMRNLLGKLGFSYCGVIRVEEDDDPRYAFEKVR